LWYFNSQAWGRGLSRDFIKNRTVTGFFHSIFASKRRISDDANTGKPAAQILLVKLAGDDSVLDQKLERNDPEGVFVGGFEDDRAGGSSLLDLQPAGCTDAPAVSGFEAGEAELGHGSAEVVAEGFGGRKERSIDDAADGVDAVVVGAGLATAGAVEAGHGLATADVEGLAKNVSAAVFDGFDGGHRFIVSP
jgi:hypothetical protein